jgi:hypothetical protein
VNPLRLRFNEEMSMKSRTCLSFTSLGAMLALAIALFATEAGAANRLYNLGLTQVWSECAALGRYNVRLTFTPVAGVTTYHVASGNQCQLRNAVCGISGSACTTTCTGAGPCELVLSQCLQGRGGSWAGIYAPGRSQRAATSAPRRCT